jgi:hypothetical protein
VFQLWYFAVHPEKAMRPAMDRIIEAGQTYFPGIDKLTRKQHPRPFTLVLLIGWGANDHQANRREA